MANKKRPFDRLFSQLQDVTDEKGRFLNTVLWSKGGDCSVIFEMTNPIEQYATDAELYLLFHDVMSSVVKTLGEGYAVQKQDVFCRQKYHHPVSQDAPFLTQRYFAHFEGREYTDIRTFLIVTQEAQRGKFVQYDAKRWAEFHTKVAKVSDLLKDKGIVRHLSLYFTLPPLSTSTVILSLTITVSIRVCFHSVCKVSLTTMLSFCVLR